MHLLTDIYTSYEKQFCSTGEKVKEKKWKFKKGEADEQGENEMTRRTTTNEHAMNEARGCRMVTLCAGGRQWCLDRDIVPNLQGGVTCLLSFSCAPPSQQMSAWCGKSLKERGTGL